jgi:predicted metalloprotease with PDZ domain
MIHYQIAMPEPHTHLFHLTIDIPDLTTDASDLRLPVWTPGSYMVREYARHLQEFAAYDEHDQPLPWRKTAKETWRVEHAGQTHIRVRYKVYANELTVRTSHLDPSHGYFNGACVFLYLVGRTNEALSIDVLTPHTWRVDTGMTPRGDVVDDDEGRCWPFQVADYDELVDSPVECGTQRVLPFTVDDIPHRIVIWGHGNEDEDRLVADTRRIVEIQRDFFGGLPYEHYLFLLHLTDGRGGGLEHHNSASNMLGRWSFRPERAYERYLSLTSHELFHAWNVKRLRPETLGPFDYSAENYTRLLWAMEGVTSYYDELLLVRAGLMAPERYLEKVADEIVRLQEQPGRHLQSLEQSSFDTWIKLYRPDENSTNSSISYYLKGSLVCLLLDLEIRRRSEGACSLDDVQRYLYQAYPAAGSGIPEQDAYLAAIETVAGTHDGAFRDFFARYISGTEELDYERAFDHAGLALHWGYRSPPPGGSTPAWLGATLSSQNQHAIVRNVRSDGPAYAAGLSANDEILAIDGWRIRSEADLHARLAEHAPGDTINLSLFRGDILIELAVVLTAAPYDQLTITRIDQPLPIQRQIYKSWLGL